MWLSKQKRKAGSATFIPDSFVQQQSAVNFPQTHDQSSEFEFPDLTARKDKSGKSPLLVSLNRFVPTTFEAVAEPHDNGQQNLEDARRHILRQLETYKKQQQDELYQQRVQAEKEAEERVLAAKRAATEIRLAAEKKGYDEGLARGEQKIAEQIKNLAEILRRLLSLQEKLTQKYEQQVINLAIEIARKIVQREISLTPEIIFTMAKQAIAEMPHESPMTLKLHPEDYQVLKDKLPLLAQEFELLGELRLVASDTVERGGCLLETPAGRVDASLESQFAAVKDTLKG